MLSKELNEKSTILAGVKEKTKAYVEKLNSEKAAAVAALEQQVVGGGTGGGGDGIDRGVLFPLFAAVSASTSISRNPCNVCLIRGRGRCGAQENLGRTQKPPKKRGGGVVLLPLHPFCVFNDVTFREVRRVIFFGGILMLRWASKRPTEVLFCVFLCPPDQSHTSIVKRIGLGVADQRTRWAAVASQGAT